MHVTIYSTHGFDRKYIEEELRRHTLHMMETRLCRDTASLAKWSEAVAIFVNDDASAPVLEKLKAVGVKYLALRSAGYNHVDLKAAAQFGISVARVPEYSPAAVAEHTVALMLGLNRKLVRAHNRVRDMNFSLDGLVGFDMAGKTAGIIGTGKIGSRVAQILHGFGCHVLACDQNENGELKSNNDVQYTDYDGLFRNSDIISLHVPLSSRTHYLINNEAIDKMKKGVMLINTSRGGLIDTRSVVDALKRGHIGYFGMDVYEEEEGLFFEDHSE